MRTVSYWRRRVTFGVVLGAASFRNNSTPAIDAAARPASNPFIAVEDIVHKSSDVMHCAPELPEIPGHHSVWPDLPIALIDFYPSGLTNRAAQDASRWRV